MQRNPDWNDLEKRARKMSDEALAYSANDAMEAAECAEAIEREGIPERSCAKSGGYYRDEATIYRTELRKRANKNDKVLRTDDDGIISLED